MLGSYEWDFSVIGNYWPMLLHGIQITILLVFVTMISALVLGLAVAVARVSRYKLLQYAAAAYTEFLRGTPLLVQLYWVYYLFPVSAFVAGYLGLTLNLSAFIAEVYRSGLQSIDKGQREAGLAVGMSNFTVMRRVLIPQAVMRVIPPLGTYWISCFRDTSLVAIIGVYELTHAAQLISQGLRSHPDYQPFLANDLHVHQRWARHLCREQQFAEALDVLDQAHRRRPNVDLFDRGRFAVRQQWDAALAEK